MLYKQNLTLLVEGLCNDLKCRLSGGAYQCPDGQELDTDLSCRSACSIIFRETELFLFLIKKDYEKEKEGHQHYMFDAMYI